jgi:MFS transporter, SP family, solute carrier family 2 (myo-inositol transporter), member 13
MAGMTTLEYEALTDRPNVKWYLPFLILIAGMGGLVAGVDYGIISGALLFVDKTIPMTAVQLGAMVSIYIGGGFVASLFAGALADFVGRKKMMILSGLLFVISILTIYSSSGYSMLLVGRTLMGLSGGLICVVVPLYMAECLPSSWRGRGTSAFQFMVTLGFAMATWIAGFFTNAHDAAVKAALGNAELIFQADNQAWRNMFLVAAVPGLIFTVGALLLRESPRWLFRRNRHEQAMSILRLSRSEEQAAMEMAEMGQHTAKVQNNAATGSDSLLQRKYIVPFIIACIVAAGTQATGINTVFSYTPKIMKGSGLTEAQTVLSMSIITGINCVVTLLAAALVDKLGRKVLLSLGTAGIIVSLSTVGFLYNRFESQSMDVTAKVIAALPADGHTLTLPVNETVIGKLQDNAPGQLSVVYSYQDGKPSTATVFSNAENPADRILSIKPKSTERWVTANGVKTIERTESEHGRLTIQRARYAPIPSGNTGIWITIALCAFIAFFAMGPGVCVWLAMTELMPTRIRANGISIAMLFNTGAQFASAFLFPVVVINYGFHVMFFVWAGCTVIYFITAAFFMPETKGKTLEEIEDYFEGKTHAKTT